MYLYVPYVLYVLCVCSMVDLKRWRVKHQLLKYFIHFIVFALNLMAFNFYIGKISGKENANEMCKKES